MTKPIRRQVLEGEIDWGDPKDLMEQDPSGWLRIVPVGLADVQRVKRRRIEREDDGTVDLEQVLDVKTFFRGDAWDAGPRFLVSWELLDTLRANGVTGWTAEVAKHATPNAVNGRWPFWLRVDGYTGEVDPSVSFRPEEHPRGRDYGHHGTPIAPLSFVGEPDRTRDINASPWFATSALPFRVLVVRARILQDFVRRIGRAPELGWEPITLETAGSAGIADNLPDIPETPEPPRARGRDEIAEHLIATAATFDHHLPEALPATDRDAAFSRVESRFGPIPERVKSLLSRWDGPSLFAGALGLFSLTPRSNGNALPESHQHVGVPDDLLSANERVNPDDWLLKKPPGAVVFGWRAADPEAIWAVEPDGRILLLTQAGEVLGPNVGVDEWLDDQLRDLEWARANDEWESEWFGE